MRASHHRLKEELRRKASSSDMSPPSATLTDACMRIAGSMSDNTSMRTQQVVTTAHGTWLALGLG